jgi:hypothetical protein
MIYEFCICEDNDTAKVRDEAISPVRTQEVTLTAEID